MHPLERLVNLVAMLLQAQRPRTFEEIRSEMPEAYGQEDLASAKRMFERDKDTLREVGIPVEVTATDAWEVDQGYRIPKDRYYLPEISFTADEVWALFLAAHAGEDAEAERAFWKLATGVDTDLLAAMAERPVAPGMDASGPSLGAIADAIARRRTVRFRYRPTQGRPGRRDVHPYALLFRGGNWYLVGEDAAKGEVRSYRLSRIVGGVKEAGPAPAPPPGFRASEVLHIGPWGVGEPDVTATVAFGPAIAWWALPSTTGARRVEVRPDGWTVAAVPASRTDSFVSWVLSFGPDAEVLAPPSLRAQVLARLEALVGDG